MLKQTTPKNRNLAASMNTIEEKLQDVPSFSASEGEIEDLMNTFFKNQEEDTHQLRN